MGISEEDLPGIGRRYELDVRDMDRLVAVVHSGGQRDLFAFSTRASEARASIHLDEPAARELGAVLTGAYYRPANAESVTSIIDRFTLESIALEPDSPACGRTIEDLQARELTGSSVVAIVSGRTAFVDPQPSTVFSAGDVVVVVGQRVEVEAFRELVRPAPNAEPSP